MSASLSVQRMVFAALSAVPGLRGVHDAPPVDAAAPYAVIGDDLVTDWSSKSFAGCEHRLRIGVWSDAPSRAAVQPLLAAVRAALSGLSGSNGGHRIVSVLFLRQLVIAEPGGWTQGIVELRIRSVAESI